MFNRLIQVGLMLACAYGAPALARNDYEHNRCNMTNGDNSSVLTFDLPVGDHYVGRDVPIGAPVSEPWQAFYAKSNENWSARCNRTAPDLPQPVFWSRLVAVAPIYPGVVPPLVGRDLTGKIFQTNVPGVGIAVELVSPYNGGFENQFTPTTPGTLPPFEAYNDWTRFVSAIDFDTVGLRGSLIKIGPISPGVHTITGILYKGSFTPDLPNAYTVAFHGTVRQAQCSLDPTNPVSDSPVKLGSWITDDFSEPVSTTAAVPFHINLLNCEDNPGQDRYGYSTAHIQLEGSGGSTIIDADLGLFSLTTDSTAAGVGIQMLAADGLTPVKLGTPVPIARIAPSGATQLNLAARYRRLPSGAIVRPGNARGALNFTITYL